MKKGLMATKIGMTQVFMEDGVRVSVTVLQVLPNSVVSKKVSERDGYTALQLATGEKREKLFSKAVKGHYAKAGVTPQRYLREFRMSQEDLDSHEIGSEINLSFFDHVNSVDVAGTSKGKGFAGVMKRHNFKGFKASHGTHEMFRHGGSIGMRSEPGKVFKGKKMAGRMGNERILALNLRVIRLMPEENLLLLRGAVPGSKGQMVEVYPSTRKPKSIKGVAGHTKDAASKNPVKASKAGDKK